MHAQVWLKDKRKHVCCRSLHQNLDSTSCKLAEATKWVELVHCIRARVSGCSCPAAAKAPLELPSSKGSGKSRFKSTSPLQKNSTRRSLCTAASAGAAQWQRFEKVPVQVHVAPADKRKEECALQHLLSLPSSTGSGEHLFKSTLPLQKRQKECLCTAASAGVAQQQRFDKVPVQVHITPADKREKHLPYSICCKAQQERIWDVPVSEHHPCRTNHKKVCALKRLLELPSSKGSERSLFCTSPLQKRGKKSLCTAASAKKRH